MLASVAPVVGITITPGVPLRPISCARSFMLCSTGSTSAAFFASKPAFACCWISAVVSFLPSLWPVGKSRYGGGQIGIRPFC